MSSYHHGNLRAALLDQAITVIGNNGVESLSLRKVAKDLGVSHAAPTRHFKSKADLLTAIVKDAYLELTETILVDAENAMSDDSIVRLNLMARSTIRWALNNRAKFTVMTNPDVSRFADDELKAALGAFSQTVAEAIEKATQQGFRKTVSVPTLLLYSVGAALGAATILTDEFMQSVLGTPNNDQIIAEIANQIIPLN